MTEVTISYEPSVTCEAFMDDPSFVRGLMGPIGSGKSVTCCMELMKLAYQQEADSVGMKRSRWAVIRNTYRELEDTTIRTWFDWVPEEIGTWKAVDKEFHIDIGDVHAEFMFRALDRPDDIKKLLSLELTGAWINEAREVPRQVLDMLQGRVGRYPSMRDGTGPTRNCIIMDTNPPDTDHWWYRLFEEEMPDGWMVFKQPSGLSKEAENIANLPNDYYTRLQSGHDQAWIDVYVHGKYGFVKDGKPVFPMYKDNVHCLSKLPALLKGDIYLGVDFGLTPAAVIAQKASDGQWIIFDELVTEDTDAQEFGELLAAKLREQYPKRRVKAWGDPAGDQRSGVDKRTPFQVVRKAGVPVHPCPFPGQVNDVVLRLGAVSASLMKLTMSGVPRLVLSPKCINLRKALAGGYKYRRIQVSNEERYKEEPDKNRYSHVADALQYLLVGGGEAREMIRPSIDVNKFKVKRAIRPRRSAHG